MTFSAQRARCLICSYRKGSWMWWANSTRGREKTLQYPHLASTMAKTVNLIFGVKAESQPPISFPSADWTVNPVCGFTFLKFCDDAVLDHIIKFSFDVVFEADWHASWRMNHWWNIVVDCNMVLPLELPDANKTLGYCVIRSCLSLIRVVFLACSRVLSFRHPWLQVLECCACIAQLNCSRFRSVEISRPMTTGLGMSGT